MSRGAPQHLQQIHQQQQIATQKQKQEQGWKLKRFAIQNVCSNYYSRETVTKSTSPGEYRDEGMGTERPERKKKYIWTTCLVNHDLTNRFCCYWCSTLFNYDRYSCIGAFFDLIELLKVIFIYLYLYLVFWDSIISRFWIFCCW